MLVAAPQIEHQQDQRQQAATDDIRFHGMKHAEDGLDVLIDPGSAAPGQRNAGMQFPHRSPDVRRTPGPRQGSAGA